MARKCDMISPYQLATHDYTDALSWHPRVMLDKSSSGYDHNDGISLMINRIIWRFEQSARAIVASEHVPGFANPPPGTSCSSGCDEGVNILVDLKKDVARR